MDDLKTRLENLRGEADDCELIARLSADLTRRASFAKRAVKLRASVREVEQAIKSRSTAESDASQGPVGPQQRPAASDELLP